MNNQLFKIQGVFLVKEQLSAQICQESLSQATPRKCYAAPMLIHFSTQDVQKDLQLTEVHNVISASVGPS